MVKPKSNNLQYIGIHLGLQPKTSWRVSQPFKSSF